MQTLLNKYRVFIWDFDGTLFDTYPETVRAYIGARFTAHKVTKKFAHLQE